MADKWINLTTLDRDILIHLLENSTEGLEKEKTALLKKLKKANSKISVYSAKAKGSGLQKWVCEKISKLINLPFDNQDDSCLIHSREMSQAGVDVVLRGKAIKRFPFSIECKSTESLNVREFVNQAKCNLKEGLDWMVVIKTKSLPETMVLISWEAFERVFKGGRKRAKEKKAS